MEKIGQKSGKDLIWKVVHHQYGIWGPGRVLLESEEDYVVSNCMRIALMVKDLVFH